MGNNVHLLGNYGGESPFSEQKGFDIDSTSAAVDLGYLEEDSFLDLNRAETGVCVDNTCSSDEILGYLPEKLEDPPEKINSLKAFCRLSPSLFSHESFDETLVPLLGKLIHKQTKKLKKLRDMDVSLRIEIGAAALKVKEFCTVYGYDSRCYIERIFFRYLSGKNYEKARHIKDYMLASVIPDVDDWLFLGITNLVLLSKCLKQGDGSVGSIKPLLLKYNVLGDGGTYLFNEEYDSSGASFIRGVIFVEKVQDIVFTHSPELEITERLVEQLFEFGIELNCDVRKGGVKLAEKVAKRIYCAVDEDVALAAVNQLRENLGVDSRDRQTSNSDNNRKCCLGLFRKPILLVPDCCKDDTLKLSEVMRVEISDLIKLLILKFYD
jgi:hypothetical protein